MTELAKRYGGSLYDLAAEEALTDRLLTGAADRGGQHQGRAAVSAAAGNDQRT